ncbi:MAG: DNA-deoxyinosine glycosylase [Eubacterium sp.]|nr:DNA-deoxyinosine glycosylase [Eubacterium sp.]
MKEQFLVHPIPPTWDESSRVLILGSFPSVKSREMGYFYGHPQNRFWKVLARIFAEEVPMTVEERRAFLLRHHLAAWDVLASCRITGSSDSSIRDAVPNDILPILEGSQIRTICCNGKKSHQIYRKYMEPAVGREAVCLPSTSPANAAWSLERLTAAWGEVIRG